jgi:hypothetical protein
MARFEEMRVFAAVVDAGSFVGASDALEMSKAMVSRYVAELESRPGVRLLHRTTRKLLLTPEGEVFHTRFRELLAGPSGASDVTMRSMHLGFSSTVTTLSSDDGGVVPVAPSPAALADACLRHQPPTAGELEHAIDVVEDALMAAKAPRSSGGGLTTFEATLRQLPGLDAVGATLSRDAVEVLFQQLASVALGMPDPGGAVFADREVAAALLITRECMHHLGFESIRMERASPS